MAKNTKKESAMISSLREALATFKLKVFKEWLKEHNKPLYRSFKDQPLTVQMAVMCKQICDRTDMLGTDAHKQAVKWLTEHNMKGRLF